MIKPAGSLLHEHMIKNFKSDDVILTENNIIVTEITDIYSNNNSTFASSNELFGTLISGTGLEDTELLLQDDKNNNNNTEMNGMKMVPHS